MQWKRQRRSKTTAHAKQISPADVISVLVALALATHHAGALARLFTLFQVAPYLAVNFAANASVACQDGVGEGGDFI